MVEKNERLKREYKIQYGDFKIKYGTYNKNNPKSLYIEVGLWVKYNGDLRYYSERMQQTTTSIRSSIKKILNTTNLLADSFIFVLNTKKNITNKEKAFFVCADISISQNEPLNNDISVFNDYVRDIGVEIINIINKSSYLETLIAVRN